MKCFKRKLYLLFVVFSPLVFILSAMAPESSSGKTDESQKVATWTESQPHTMETKTSMGIEGTVHAINKKANMLTVKTKEGKIIDLSLSADTKITVGTETKSLSDLARGQKIKAAYSKKDGKNVADTIEAEVIPKKKEKKKE